VLLWLCVLQAQRLSPTSKGRWVKQKVKKVNPNVEDVVAEVEVAERITLSIEMRVSATHTRQAQL